MGEEAAVPSGVMSIMLRAPLRTNPTPGLKSNVASLLQTRFSSRLPENVLEAGSVHQGCAP
jgi:hypothetical protein